MAGGVRLPDRLGIDKSGIVRAFCEEMVKQGRRFVHEPPSGLGLYSYVWLGAVPKDLRPLCGARRRKGTPCQCRAMPYRERCRMHGGMSTGPKTAEGRARIAESNRRRAELRRAQVCDQRQQRMEQSGTGNEGFASLTSL